MIQSVFSFSCTLETLTFANFTLVISVVIASMNNGIVPLILSDHSNEQQIENENWQAWINIYKDKNGAMAFEKQVFGTWAKS